MILQPSHLPSTSLCADDEQGKMQQYAAAQGFHSYLQVLLTWAVPGPSNPFSQKPHPFPPSAAGTPRSPENCCFPPHHCCSRTEQTTGLAEVSETREMPEVRIALGGSPGSERSCCSLWVVWERGLSISAGATEAGGRALSCLLELGGGKPSKCNCGVWWLFYNLGL